MPPVLRDPDESLIHLPTMLAQSLDAVTKTVEAAVLVAVTTSRLDRVERIERVFQPERTHWS